MNADDMTFGAPEGLTTEEAAELANVLPPTLEEAYAEGRTDQHEEDCAVVRKLLEELDDADALTDGRINTTRVREMLEHFERGAVGAA